MLVNNSALAEGFIEHEKHIHGQAQLNIAIEENNIEIEFSTPAMNLLGFEYKPASTKDKHQLEHTLTTLRQGKMLFKLGACQLKDNEISSTLFEEHHNGNHRDGKHSASPHDHDRKNISQHQTKHQTNHSDITAHYQFVCSKGIPDKIETSLFDNFPSLLHITVTVLGEHQSQSTLRQTHNIIDLL